MIVVRTCNGFDELDACVQLQIETWGYDPMDIVPRKSFVIDQKIGGQVIGAFDTEIPGAKAKGGPESLVGFVFSLPGIKTKVTGPVPYLHSHLLAVRESYFNRGLGLQLKLAQRGEALARGIAHMEWTFDPLEIKNAYFNIHKLGVVVCSYRENFYGVSSSRLQGGLPTDRLVAEWKLDSPQVQEVLAGQAATAYKIEERVFVPASIHQWKASETERHLARELQSENRKKFQNAFANGLAVVGFTRDSDGNGMYELGRNSL